MRVERAVAVSCLLVWLLLAGTGCSKKADDDAPGGTTRTPTATVDTTKPLTELKAEAETMSAENLRSTAVKYKDAILARKDDIEKLTAKIKDIPMMEALGQEAQSLKTDLTDIESALAALKDRFQVYYNALKEKGGDLSGLEL